MNDRFDPGNLEFLDWSDIFICDVDGFEFSYIEFFDRAASVFLCSVNL